MLPIEADSSNYKCWRDSDKMLPLLAKCDLLYSDPYTTPTPRLTLMRQAGRIAHQCPALTSRLHTIIESDMSHETKMAELGAAQLLIDRSQELQEGSLINQVTDIDCFILRDGSFNLGAPDLFRLLPFVQRAGHKLLAAELSLGRALFREVQKPIFVNSSMAYLIGKSRDPSTAAKSRACLLTLFQQKGILGYYAQNFPVHLHRFMTDSLLKSTFSIDGTSFNIPTLLSAPATLSTLLKIYMNLLCYNYEAGIYNKHEFIELLMMQIPKFHDHTLLAFKQALIAHIWFDKKGVFFFKDNKIIRLNTLANLQQVLCALSLCVNPKDCYVLHQFLLSNEMTTVLACYVAVKNESDIDESFALGKFTLPKKKDSSYIIFEQMLGCQSLHSDLEATAPLHLLNLLGGIKQREAAFFIHGPKIQFLFYPSSSFSIQITEHLKRACKQFNSPAPLIFENLVKEKHGTCLKTSRTILKQSPAENHESTLTFIDKELTKLSRLESVVVGELKDGNLLVTKYNFGTMQMTFYRQIEKKLYPIDFSHFTQLEVISPMEE